MLTDVNLGDGITGWELARRAREIAPGFPVNMTSASAPDWESQGVDGSVLIEKPFAPAQLAAAVSQLLVRRLSRVESLFEPAMLAMRWPCMRPRRDPLLPPSSPAAGLCPPSKRTRAA